LANAKGSRLFVVFLISLAWSALLGLQFIGHWRLVLIVGLVPGALQTFHLLRQRQSIDHPGLIQVRLSRRGCVQYNSLTAPSVFNDLIGAHLWLVPIFAAAGLVAVHHFGRLSSLQFWIWVPIALLIGGVLWPLCRRYRVALKNLPANAITDANAVVFRPTPWTVVSDYSLAQGQRGECRLIIRREKTWARDVREYVNADIRCNEEQAQKLRELLDAWLEIGRREQELKRFRDS